VLNTKFAADPRIGLVGVAGTQYLFADNCRGFPRSAVIRGRVIHEVKQCPAVRWLTVFSWDKSDAEVWLPTAVFRDPQAPV